MGKIKIMLGYVSKDKDDALTIIAALKEAFKDQIELLYMDDEINGCVDDWVVWTEKNILACNILCSYWSDNTMEGNSIFNGITINNKVIRSEIGFAKEKSKHIVIVDNVHGNYAEGYELEAQGISRAYIRNGLGSTLNDIVTQIKRCISLIERNGYPEYFTPSQRLKKTNYSYLGIGSRFIGRENELAQIDDLFNSGKKVVCLSGFGGIGKTELAKAYAEKSRKQGKVDVICYTVCSDDTEIKMKNIIINLPFEQTPEDFKDLDDDEKYNYRLNQLAKVDSRTLIMVDNFNASLTGDNENCLNNVIEKIECKFLISTRSKSKADQIGLIEVGRLSDGELIDLFYKNCDDYLTKTKENDALIKEIIERTDGHTMTIELASRVMAYGDYSLIDIRDHLFDFSDEVECGHTTKEQSIMKHTRALFNLANIDEDGKKILFALSFICQRGIKKGELRKICNLENANEINTLVKKGFIKEENNYLRLHPIVSLLVSKDVEYNEDIYKEVFLWVIKSKCIDGNDDNNSLEDKLDYWEYFISRLREIIKNNPTLEQKRDLSVSYERIGNVFINLGGRDNLEKAKEMYEKSLKIDLEIFNSSANPTLQQKRDLSVSYEKIGNVFINLGGRENLEKAKEMYEKSLEIRLEIYNSSPNPTLEQKRDLSVSYEKIGNVLCNLGGRENLEKAKEMYEKGLKIRLEIVSSTNPTLQQKRDLSVSYNNLGDVLIKHGGMDNLEQAKEMHEKSLKIDLEIYNLSPNPTLQQKRDLSVSYERIGDVLVRLGGRDNLEKAKEMCEKSLEIRLEIYNSSPNPTIEQKRDLSVSYEKIGNVFINLGGRDNLEHAKEMYEKSLEIRLEIYNSSTNPTLEQKRDLSISCIKLAFVYNKMGDNNAKNYYFSKALEIYPDLAKELGI